MHLTPTEKREELSGWLAKCQAPHGRSESGLPDAAIVPWCERLNAIEGLCTVQSCAGHGPDGEGYRSCGHLWLRLSGPMMRRFVERAHLLAARKKNIEWLGLSFTPDEAAVAVVKFAGIEQGRLDESMVIILDYFQSLALSLVWGDGD